MGLTEDALEHGRMEGFPLGATICVLPYDVSEICIFREGNCKRAHFVLIHASTKRGVRRPITVFSDADSPITVAIISETPLPVNSSDRLTDELIQTPSASDAIRQPLASTNPSKALVVTTGADTRAIPGNIQVVQIKPDNLSKWMDELHN
jgi:hypothetical protein